MKFGCNTIHGQKDDNPDLFQPYGSLSAEEKIKDLEQLKVALDLHYKGGSCCTAAFQTSIQKYKMKLLLEHWRNYVLKESTGAIWYHTTHETTADSVEEEGIYTDHGGYVGGFTLGVHWADEIYGMRPVYLSKEPNKSTTREYDGTTFEVNVGNDMIFPDIPSLEDHDANVEDDHVWWPDRDEVPEPLQTYMNNAGWGSPYDD